MTEWPPTGSSSSTPGRSAAAGAHRPPSQLVVLVRHGESRWNAEGRFQGHADSPLSDTGHAQAKEVAATLARILDGRETTVVASDLQRAHATATAIAEALGSGDVVSDPRLREVDVGAWQGLAHTEVARRWPELQRAWRAREDVSVPGGERPGEAGRRARLAVAGHAADAQVARRVLVAVGHGASLRWAVAQGLQWTDGPRRLGELGNAHWSEARLPVPGHDGTDHAGPWRLDRWNVPPR